MTGLEGQSFAGYEVIAKLGEGGMGSVYKARQTILNRLVALKVMSPQLGKDPDFVARFQREASASASLGHPNIVQVYAGGESEGIHYIAMEFIEGKTLRNRIDAGGRMDPREAIAITVYVAQALQHAWNKCRLIHRDIKPDNIFLSKNGEVKLGDLGLAKTVGAQTTGLTATGMMMGSPHYISPEQAKAAKDIDFRADLYSLGCTLYHMLTGQTPYDGDSAMVVMGKHVNEPPPAIFKVLPGCPMPLGMFVDKMLAKNRNDRPKSYEELISQLLEIHEKLPVAGAPRPAVSSSAPTVAAATPKVATRQPTAAARQKKSPRLVYAIAGIVVVVAGLFLWAPWKQSAGGNAPFRGAKIAQIRNVQADPEPHTGPADVPEAQGKMSKLKNAGEWPAKFPNKFGKILFDGGDVSAWQQRDGSPCSWKIVEGALVAGASDIETRSKFYDFTLHVEFSVPRDAKQGNSGVYLQGRYEIQILDSFGKPADSTCNGAIFNIRAPDENPSTSPDTWQAFEITFTAARFNASARKTKNARVSVIHNGKLVHDNVEIPNSTGQGDPETPSPGPIRLQAFGSPVRFRNMMVAVPRPSSTSAPATDAFAKEIAAHH